MTDEQARRLAALIIDTWPTRVIKAYIWTDALIDLDHQPALGVYEYLRDTDEHPPTVARFLGIYHSAQPDYGWQTPTETGATVSPQMGRQIARIAYAEECERQGRQPNWGFIDEILRTIP